MDQCFKPPSEGNSLLTFFLVRATEGAGKGVGSSGADGMPSFTLTSTSRGTATVLISIGTVTEGSWTGVGNTSSALLGSFVGRWIVFGARCTSNVPLFRR